MGVLATAIPQQNRAPEQTVHSGYGSYRGFFVGMTAPIEEVSEFAGDKCRLCKGDGTGYNGQGECRQCRGSGKRTESFVKLRYYLENKNTEEERVAFKLTPPGTGRDGTALSASSLFKRLRTFSQMRDASADQLDQWYSGLSEPIKIPITVIIGDNNKGNALKITDVLFRDEQRQQAAALPPRQAAPPAQQAVKTASQAEYSFDGDPGVKTAADEWDGDVPF